MLFLLQKYNNYIKKKSSCRKEFFVYFVKITVSLDSSPTKNKWRTLNDSLAHVEYQPQYNSTFTYITCQKLKHKNVSMQMR